MLDEAPEDEEEWSTDGEDCPDLPRYANITPNESLQAALPCNINLRNSDFASMRKLSFD